MPTEPPREPAPDPLPVVRPESDEREHTLPEEAAAALKKGDRLMDPEGHGDLSDVPEPSDTLALARRAKAGDEQALGDLIERHLPWLRRQVSRRLEPGLRACLDTFDVLQDGCMIVAGKLSELDLHSDREVRNWMLKVTLNQLKDIRRYEHAGKRDRRRQQRLGGATHPHSSDAQTPELPVDQASPSSVVGREELKSMLEEAIADLSESYREVVRLRDFEGLSWSAVCERMGTPSVGSTRQLYYRARIRIRRQLPKGMDDGLP